MSTYLQVCLTEHEAAHASAGSLSAVASRPTSLRQFFASSFMPNPDTQESNTHPSRAGPLPSVGEGAFGSVWQCKEAPTGREVAVKGRTTTRRYVRHDAHKALAAPPTAQGPVRASADASRQQLQHSCVHPFATTLPYLPVSHVMGDVAGRSVMRSHDDTHTKFRVKSAGWCCTKTCACVD
jgi:hypothetical protein